MLTKRFFDIRILTYQRKDDSVIFCDQSYYSIELSESVTDDVFAVLKKRGYVSWNGEIPFRLVYRSELQMKFSEDVLENILTIVRNIKKIPPEYRCALHKTQYWINYEINQLDEYTIIPSDDEPVNGFEYKIFIQPSQEKYTFYEKDQQIAIEQSGVLALHLCSHAAEILRAEQRNKPIEYLMLTACGGTEQLYEDIFSEIATQKTLRGLMIRFYKNEKITANLVKKLQMLPRLEVLTLENIDSDVLDVIREMRNLRGLRLEYSTSGKIGSNTEFDFLQHMDSLEYLDLRLSDTKVGMLKMPPHLKCFISNDIPPENHTSENTYSLPGIEEIVKDTHNFTFYNDQKDRIAQKITGCSLDEARNFRVNVGCLITPRHKYFMLLVAMHMGITIESAGKYYREWGHIPEQLREKIAQELYKKTLKKLDVVS